MNVEQIMKLVDALSEASFEQGLNRLRDFPEQNRDAVVAAIEQLTKDADRLNWLESSTETHGFCHTGCGDYRHYALQTAGYASVREVIDTAMKEEESA